MTQPGHLLRAERALHRHIIGLLPRPNGVTGDIVDLDPAACSAVTTAIAHFTVGQRRELGIASGAPACGAARCRDAPRRGQLAQRRCGWMHSCCATSTGLAMARSIGALAWGLEIFVRARARTPCRRPRVGCAAPTADYEVELVAGEEGRLARTGLRVLRRGFRDPRACSVAASSRARPRRHCPQAALQPCPLAEAMRG